MKVKVFEGKSVEIVLQQIKAEFGEGFTILYQDTIKEKTFIPFIKRKKYVFVVEKKEEEENIEEVLSEEDIIDEKEVNEETNSFAQIIKRYETIDEEKEEDSQIKVRENYFDKRQTKKITINTDNLTDDILEEFTGKSIDLIKLLIEKDVEVDVAREVVKHSCGFEIDSGKMDLKHYTFRESLIEGVESTVNFAGDIFEKNLSEGRRKVYAFLGPTGVGKTTNLFKIASKLVLEKGKKVAVISTDTFKAGAGEQIRGYTNILKIPYGIFSDPKKLRETLDDWADFDVILIDTVGRSHYDHWKIGEIREVLKYADETEYILTLSCNMNKKEMYSIVEKFGKFFDLKYIFFTKIDETSYPGSLLNLPVKTGLKLTYISTGQNVPEDIKILTPERVVSYFLMERS
ncbi:MAG: flagellar biosynthesis protein FlhF [Hydrogenothermaceae bacterium]|nr:flagellar biosynthesis protein FlhF [Hydrogenothermaceae bacterium]